MPIDTFMHDVRNASCLRRDARNYVRIRFREPHRGTVLTRGYKQERCLAHDTIKLKTPLFRPLVYEAMDDGCVGLVPKVRRGADDVELDCVPSCRQPHRGRHGDRTPFSVPIDADKDKVADIGRSSSIMRRDFLRMNVRSPWNGVNASRIRSVV